MKYLRNKEENLYRLRLTFIVENYEICMKWTKSGNDVIRFK